MPLAAPKNSHVLPEVYGVWPVLESAPRGTTRVGVHLSPSRPVTLHLTIGNSLPSDWIANTSGPPAP